MGDLVASRTLNELYIYLDIAFLVILGAFLWITKRRVAFWFGIAGGLLYFAVDYGIFYLALHTRTVTGANTELFLLWLSMSYGFTNFVWIWLMLNRDKHRVKWSVLIASGWICSAMMSNSFGGNFGEIQIARGTNSYHGIMALWLFVGFALLFIYNLRVKEKSKQAPILYLVVIGVSVQFAWEFILLITGIRAVGIMPLIVNSLVETTLGMPGIYLIHRLVTKRWNEDMSRKLPKPTEA